MIIENIQAAVDNLPFALQFLAIVGVGAIPFLESYGGSAIGVVAGLPAPIAILAAIIGNMLCTGLLIIAASKTRSALTKNNAPLSPRRQKLRGALDRFGVAGVSLLGPLLLASQITGPALIGFGASRVKVLIWQAIAITVWGIAFGTLASLGLSAFTGV